MKKIEMKSDDGVAKAKCHEIENNGEMAWQ
jgi:hypothetical protein